MSNETISDSAKTIEQASIPTTTTTTARPDGNDTSNSTIQPPPPSTTQSISIVLDPAEEQLFRIIIEAVDAFAKGDITLDDDDDEAQMQAAGEAQSSSQQQHRPPHDVVVRVAGGWVRDKVAQHYGGTGYDVDLAVEHTTGVQLAKVILSYVQKYYPDLPGVSRRMGVIAANPDQSKHLETATFKLCGIDMDLCNLRAHEVYTADSRIPVVRLGTPLEDSLRRDFTVNALYYNLHTKMVEDWTGKGVRDLLERQVLVTPLEPVQTFRDDPLRILRAVRFAVRLRLTMDDSMKEAAQLPEIRQALGSKVSRERFGKELEGMLSGKQARPLLALQTMIALQLAPIVFALPQAGVEKVGGVQGTIMGAAYHGSVANKDDQAIHVGKAWTQSVELLQITVPSTAFFESMIQEQHKPKARLLSLAVILSPFRYLTYFEVKKPDRLQSVVGYIVRDSIKFKKDDVNALTLLAEQVDAMVSLLSKPSEDVTRLEAGILLRSLRDLWPTALLLAAILQERQQEENMQVAVEQLYRKIVEEFKLDQCWKVKPLLDGKVLQKTFGKGPIVGAYMQEQIRWMLSHPQGTAEDCLAHLQQYQLLDDPMDADGEPMSKKPHIGSKEDQ